MDIKCACCNNVYVENEGDICFNCKLKGLTPPNNSKKQISHDPFEDKHNNSNTFSKENSESKESFHKNKNRSFGRTVVRGTVFDFKKEPDSRSQIERFTSSLIKGTPYTYMKEKYIFNVKEDNVRTLNFDSRTGSCVVINGDFAFGSITNNDVVEVVGTRNKYGVIAAEKITNISNGSKISINKQINASVIRVITFAVVALLVAGFYFLINNIAPSIGQANWDLSSNEILKKVLYIVVGVVLMFLSLKFGRLFSGKIRTIILIIGIGLILFAVSPSLLTSILASVTIIYVIFKLIKMLFK